MKQLDHQAKPVEAFLPAAPTSLLSQGIAIHDLHAEAFECLRTPEAAQIYGGIVSLKEATPEPSPSFPVRSHPSGQPNANWSTSLQTLLDQPPSSLPLRLIVSGLVFCTVFGLWAWFGRIQEVSHAQGRLVPKGEVYKVQPVAQGEITQLRVKEGETVQAGTVIAALDDRLVEAEVERLEQSLADYRLQLVQVQGLIDRTRLEMQTRRAIAAAEAQAQQAAIAQAEVEAATHRQILAQLQSEITAHEARLARLQPLVMEGAIAADHLFDVEQAMRERQQVITQHEGNLQKSQADVERLQAELAQKQAQGQQSELESQQRLQQAEVEASQLKAKIAETELLLKAARTKQQQMYLYAPVSGVVSSVSVRNVGEVTQPGQTLAEIIPEDAPLVLSALLPNREAGFVHPGMPVQMKFDAFPYQDFGLVTGKVVSIAPDVTVDPKLGPVYRVEISLDRNQITQGNQAVMLKAGQTADVEILTRQRRIADILLEPIKQLQQGGLSL